MRMKKLMALLLTLCVCASLMAPMASAYTYDSTEVPTSISMTGTTVSAGTGGSYNIVYQASLTMPSGLANTIASVVNTALLDDLRFVLTLSHTPTGADTFIETQLSGINKTNAGSFFGKTEDNKDSTSFYDLVSITPSGTKLTLEYEFNATTLSGYSTVKDLSTALTGSKVTFTSNPINVPSTQTFAIGALSSGVGVTSKVDLKWSGSTTSFINAAKGETTLRISSGGSGSSSTPSSGITLTETDTTTGNSSTTNGLNSATTDTSGNKDENDYPASGGAVSVVSVTSQNGKPKTGNPSAGDTVVINVDPNPGKKIDSVTVTMANGQKVTVEYKNDGNYQFVMPSGAIKVDVNYESCPYVPSDSGVDELLITDRHVLYTIGDDEGNWRPDANVKRDEVCIMFMRLLRNQNVAITTHYDDVPEDAWYYEAVNKISSLGIMEGDGDGNFRPEEPMTRAEFAKSCVGFATKDPIAPGADFSDVSRLAWYYSYIQKAVAYGWIEGYNGEFRPDDYITRTEAVTIINRMLARPADHDAIDNGAGTSFPDVPDNFWGRDAIEESTTAHNETVDEPTYVEEWHENGTETVNG